MCLVEFASNQNAKVHFDGPQHENRVMTMKSNAHKENAIWCEVCCCELNTIQMLETHKQSPKHLKKVNDLEKIIKKKEEYDRARAILNKSSNI